MKTTKGMKRVIFIVAFLLGATFQSFSQGYNGKGDILLNLGVGLADNVGHGGYFDYVGSRNEFPTLNISADFGVHKWITVGPYLGWHHRNINAPRTPYTVNIDGRYNSREWRITESWTYFGARGIFMFTPFLNEVANANIPDDLHLYSGLLLGMNYYHKNRIDQEFNNKYPFSVSDIHAALLAAGARYMFTQGFGAYLELYPIGYMSSVNLGLSFKF